MESSPVIPRKKDGHVDLGTRKDKIPLIISCNYLTGNLGVQDEVTAVTNFELSGLAFEIAKQH